MQEGKKQRESFDDIFNGDVTPSHNPPPAPYYTPEPEPQRNITAEPEDESYESTVAVAVIETPDATDMAIYGDDSALPSLESYNVVVDVNPDFMKWVIGEKVRVRYLGTKIIRKKENGRLVDLPVVVFRTVSGAIRIDAGYKLRETLEQFPPNTPFEIEFLGEKKTSNGNKMHDFFVGQMFIK